jgi:hypothetical protein
MPLRRRQRRREGDWVRHILEFLFQGTSSEILHRQDVLRDECVL